MTYTIKIEGMEFRSAHGCYDTEQRVGGNFVVDIVLEVEDKGASEADDVTRTVNYVEVYETVREQMAIPSRIIENAVHRILEAVSARFPQVRGARHGRPSPARRSQRPKRTRSSPSP